MSAFSVAWHNTAHPELLASSVVPGGLFELDEVHVDGEVVHLYWHVNPARPASRPWVPEGVHRPLVMQSKVRIVREVVKQCPHRPETDRGELEIMITDADAPELHQLGKAIDRISEGGPISHEDFTREVGALVPNGKVTTHWWTGPWRVEVVNSAVPGESVDAGDP